MIGVRPASQAGAESPAHARDRHCREPGRPHPQTLTPLNAADLPPDLGNGGIVSRTAEVGTAMRAVCMAPLDHSMTLSARSTMEWGILTPSALALCWLTTSSIRLAASTGMSAGLAPRKILFTTSAARRI